MKYLLSCLALATLATVAAGCAEPTLDETVQEYIQSNGASFKDCGDLEITLDCNEGAAPAAPAKCFLDGFAACEPVRVDLTSSTVEGDPIYSTYLVVPSGKTCHVEAFVDTRQDAFGPKEITRSSCGSATEGGTCSAPLVIDECTSSCAGSSDCG